MPRQSSRLCADKRLDQPGADQHVVEHAVLGEERPHHLAGDDERNEQRPAVEPAQHRHRARILAERQVAGDRDRDERRSAPSTAATIASVNSRSVV